MLLVWCLTVGSADLERAQGLLIPPAVQGVVTTNGITYVEYSFGGGQCPIVESIGPLTRNGNDFSFDFDLAGGPCKLVSPPRETNVDLGVLAPGTYSLVTSAWDVPRATNTFRIAPVLQAIGFDTNGSFRIQMSSAVTNVSYVLQCSTDLVEWTSLSTNLVSTDLVGVPLTNSPIDPPGFRFYRVLCQ